MPRSKSKKVYRSISEVADLLGVEAHVLRFWESKFDAVDPVRRSGGRRYYRTEDVELLKKIHHLLYTERYTIEGVQRLLDKDPELKNFGPDAPPGAMVAKQLELGASDGDNGQAHIPDNAVILSQVKLESILDELKSIRELI
jgi:DNA-binding transcriptional MerR regulator